MSMNAFKRELQYFGMELPKPYYAEERANGVKVCSKNLMSVSLKGEKGIASCSNKLTHGFCLTFGNFAKRKIELNDEQMIPFCSASSFKIENKKENGRYMVIYKGFSLGIVEIINGNCVSMVPKGFQRNIINKLK